MEGDLQCSKQFEFSLENDDLKYFAGLSTILVATIQEVKDRISQIEFIFCSQLFPSFQSRSKILHKRLDEAKKAAEDDWKKKEGSLLRQIEELQHEKDHAQEQAWLAMASLEQEQAKLTNYKQLLCAHESENKLLMAKVESLEKNDEISVLQEQLRQMTEEGAKGKDLEEKLLQQINLKDQELLAEQNKRKETTTQFLKLKNSFKELKSQYEFLLRRSCLPMENRVPRNRMEEEKNSLKHHGNQQSSPGNVKEAAPLAPKTREQKNDSSFEENLDDRGAKSIQNSKSHSNIKQPSISSSFLVQNCPTKAKAEMSAGQKRPVSYWRETRSRQEPGGADPHDDFLDTPMENARANLNKVLKEVEDVPRPALRGMDVDDSDDETQDANADSSLHKERPSIPVPENKGFKYVEPVRKKAERENLKGVECRQCKKFYDAVLPEEGKNNDMNNCNIRCEHHEGVSRHRYRYVPPMTPEGFWNIGFDSDL